MGGDGGVIASNRRYMRGAGTADHTGDAAHNKHIDNDPTVVRHQAARTMQYCALSQKPLFVMNKKPHASGTIVACPYGRLYLKEAAVEALLKRKQQQQQQQQTSTAGQQEDLLGRHIRGLKDLREARFQLSVVQQQSVVPTCPITGRELNGQIPAFVLQPACSSSKKKQTTTPGDDASASSFNVMSEHGLKMLADDNGNNSSTALEDEYGLQMQNKWRLAPPPTVLKEIQQAWEEQIAREDEERKAKKKKKNKRKRDADDDTKKNQPKKNKAKTVEASTTSTTGSVSDAARARVSAAVQSNKVLSSLFTADKKKLSDKEKKDHLFARS